MKMRRLGKGDPPASAYSTNFLLIAFDVPRDQQALMDQFRQGLRNDVKDMLLTFHEDPNSLIEAISLKRLDTSWCIKCTQLSLRESCQDRESH